MSGDPGPLCPHCGYSLAGSAAQVCPECGGDITEAGFRAAWAGEARRSRRAALLFFGSPLPGLVLLLAAASLGVRAWIVLFAVLPVLWASWFWLRKLGRPRGRAESAFVGFLALLMGVAYSVIFAVVAFIVVGYIALWMGSPL